MLRRIAPALLVLVLGITFFALPPNPAEAIPPDNDPFFGAQNITLGTYDIEATVEATLEASEPTPACGTGFNKSVWYEYHALANQTVTVSTFSSNFDTIVGVYRTSLQYPQITDIVPVTCDDDSGPGNDSLVSFSAQAGMTYYLQGGGYQGAFGTLILRLGILPPNDNLAAASAVTLPNSSSVNTVVATEDPGDPGCLGSSGLGTVWFKATLSPGSYVAQNLLASGTIDPILAVYSGPPSSPTFPGLTLVECNDDRSFPTFDTDSRVDLIVAAPTTYYFRVAGFGLGGYLTFTLDVNPDADVDGVADQNDNCPNTPNGPLEELSPGVGNQTDNDNDAVLGTQPPANAGWGGDACDADDDDDGAADSLDGCPFSPEDSDNWQDGDGCEDPDNDSDGICDTGLVSISCTGSDFGRFLWQNPLGSQVDCRNVAEDIDAFHDTDGCPDPDNDYDNFPDSTDDCPVTDFLAGANGIADFGGDEPVLYLVPYQGREDFDGVIDTDGCHDSPNDDYDGDGLGDETEVFTVQTDPVNPDTDGDARIDGSDNCPNWSNASQALPNWTVPANDSDCDGWNKTREQHVGTDPTKHCNADKTFNNEPDAWPGDFNDNKLTNLADVVSFGPTFNKLPNDDGYNQRYDLNVNNITNLADIVTMGPFFNKLCG